MLRAIISTALATALAIIPAKARTAADFFTSAPDHVVNLLPQSTRLDMLDYSRFGSDKASKNKLYGDARITAESPQVVSYDLSERAHQQIAMLTAGSDTIVAVVTTVDIPAADSSIEFYNTSWNSLKKQPATMPGYDEWISSGTDISATLPFVTAVASFSPDASTLTITPTIDAYLTASDLELISSRISAPKVYNISGTKLSLQK